MSQFQKQTPELFYRKSCSEKFRNIHRKTPVLESPFNRFARFCRCFPVNIAKFLRTRILMKICEQLLLQFLLLAVNISSWVLVSALNSIDLLQRSSLRCKEFSLECLVVGSSFIWKERKTNRNGHSLSFVVTRCNTRCHSMCDLPVFL